MKIAVMLPNWIGDVVMATPTLRALREQFGPDLHLTGIMRPYVADVLAGTSWLDDTIFYDRRSSNRQHRLRAVLAELRQRRLDRMLLLTNSFSTGLLSWLSGARERIGYARYGRTWMLSHPLQAPREGRELQPISAVDYYLRIASAAGCELTGPSRTELATTADDEAAADRVWQQLKLNDAERVVVLNTGGAYGAAKRWPSQHFAALAQRVASSMNAHVLVLCGPAEIDAAREITQLANHEHVVSLADQPLSIGLSKACVRRSQLMITTDSGPRHFAAAFQVPTVALFGPTDPRWSDNYNLAELALQKQLPCSPCARRVCPLQHHRCMHELSPELVYRAAAHQLRAAAQQAA